MTCIVGLVDSKKKVWLGGDSAAVAGLDVHETTLKKVFKVGPFIMGYTSSFRMGQILEHCFKPPVQKANENIMTFMVDRFADRVRDTFKKRGFARSTQGEDQGGNFLIGYKGHLFNMYSDFQVNENLSMYDSVGCGADYAMGSLWTTEQSQEPMDPQDRLVFALEAAKAHSGGVRDPWVIIHT